MDRLKDEWTIDSLYQRYVERLKARFKDRQPGGKTKRSMKDMQILRKYIQKRMQINK